MPLAPMEDEVKRCVACALHEFPRRTCTPSSGASEGVDLLFVGDMPGADDDAKDEAFRGPFGNLLRRVVEEELKGKFTVRFTNVVRCFSGSSQRKSTLYEQQTCAMRHLLPEIQSIKPKLIVALGEIPMKTLATFVPRGSVKSEGTITRTVHDFGDHPLYLLTHPRYVLYSNPAHEGKWRERIRAIEGILRPKTTVQHYEFVQTPDEAKKKLSKITGVAAFDYETEGLSPWGNAIISVAVCAKAGEAFCLDMRNPVFFDIFREWVTGPSEKVVHNAQFEDLWTREKFDRPIGGVLHDTMIWAKLYDENGNVNLKHLALLHTDMGDYSEPVKAIMGTPEWAKKTAGEIYEYNCGDADACYRLHVVQRGLSENDRSCAIAHTDALQWHGSRSNAALGSEDVDEDEDYGD